MKVLTCTLYKEQSMVYTEIQDLIAVNSCQIELARHILLSDTAVALFRVSSRTGVKNKRRNSTLLASTYSIDYFNAKPTASSSVQLDFHFIFGCIYF